MFGKLLKIKIRRLVGCQGNIYRDLQIKRKKLSEITVVRFKESKVKLSDVSEVNGYCFLLACIILMCWLRPLEFLNDFLHVSQTVVSFEACVCWFCL